VRIVVLLIALLSLIPSTASAQDSSKSTVTLTIMPGPFTASLMVDDGVAVLTVVDATGSGRGWWVTVDCSCDWVLAGGIQNPGGNAEKGPHWEGATLVAGLDEGMGTYRQKLLATQGRWVVTSSRGERP
jgi:hypothetical protein